MSHNVLDFDHYEVTPGAGGGGLRVVGDTYEWALAPGLNRLEVRGVNTRGIAGPPAVVSLTFPGQ